MKANEVFSLLLEKLTTAGVSKDLAEEYVWFIRRWNRKDINLGRIKPETLLPKDECLQTVIEVQRILASLSVNKKHPRELGVFELCRYLEVPDAQWKQAKRFIAEFYGKESTAVDSLYESNEGWLLKHSEELLDVALSLNAFFYCDSDLAWMVFQHAGLLGREETERRISTLFELLGPEDGIKLIRFDLHRDNWIFYSHNCGNPVGCIAYLKQCGLSTEQIFALLEEKGYILHLFNLRSAEARVDEIIARFIHEWEQLHGPCYEGLTIEQRDFLIRGPGTIEA